MYIEPCCIDKQLPPVVRQPFAFFQSNGDWAVQKLMSAVSHMVPESVCILVIPSVDVSLLRVLNHYLSRGWYKAVMLLTAENQEDLVRRELSGMLDRVHYAIDNHVLDGQLILTSDGLTLAIQGAMLLEPDFSLCSYSSAYGNDLRILQEVTDAIIPIFRLHTVISSENEEVVAILERKQ